jgi:hypothetical protein
MVGAGPTFRQAHGVLDRASGGTYSRRIHYGTRAWIPEVGNHSVRPGGFLVYNEKGILVSEREDLGGG